MLSRSFGCLSHSVRPSAVVFVCARAHVGKEKREKHGYQPRRRKTGLLEKILFYRKTLHSLARQLVDRRKVNEKFTGCWPNIRFPLILETSTLHSELIDEKRMVRSSSVTL